MQLWIDAQHPDGITDQPDDDRLHAGGQYHGPQADGQHPAFRNVHQPRQPDSGLGNRGRGGRLDADALHPRDPGTLGAGLTDGHTRQDAGTQQYFKTHVQLGRGDIGHRSRASYGADTLRWDLGRVDILEGPYSELSGNLSSRAERGILRSLAPLGMTACCGHFTDEKWPFRPVRFKCQHALVGAGVTSSRLSVILVDIVSIIGIQ